MVPFFSDIRPFKGISALLDWRLNGRLSQVIIKNRFTGEFKDVLLLPSEGRIKANSILLIGLGPQRGFNESHIGPLSQIVLEKMMQKKSEDFVISFSDIIGDHFEWRNSIRLMVSKLIDQPEIRGITLCEKNECVKDAKRRHMDFGLNAHVDFDDLS